MPAFILRFADPCSSSLIIIIFFLSLPVFRCYSSPASRHHSLVATPSP